MNIYIVSIFPEIFQGFLTGSLVWKAQEKELINIEIVNPRDFSKSKHKQVDDKVYGWWQGMLLMFQPIVEAIEYIIYNKIKWDDYNIIFLAPGKKELNQTIAKTYSKYKNIILLCGRYEGIDSRIEQYFFNKIEKLSIWKYVLMWGEIASMVFIEVVWRLLPGVIKEEDSVYYDSYTKEDDLGFLEHPQYTRPEEIKWLEVPKVLLSGHHKNIENWKNVNSK